MLNGGIEKFYEDYSDFVEGIDLPPLTVKKTAADKDKKKKETGKKNDIIKRH